MELLDQRTKAIFEGCKARARDAGLSFDDETLEYVVSNRDLLELAPKVMIPNLYDYWVHDVEVLREKGRYELYPDNPYETVVNTRPAISFYNDNNPDWLNIMIFYHVLGHIDFFQNNQFFRHTWGYDFNGVALSDKRLIARLRAEKGRWVDYVIEFSRGIDNLVDYYGELNRPSRGRLPSRPTRVDYYFDVFLTTRQRVSTAEFVSEIQRYNDAAKQHSDTGEDVFFAEVLQRYPEFEALYDKEASRRRAPPRDLFEYLMASSEMLNKPDNEWMKSVMQVVRSTSLFFQPQIRTKIMNEGWASYWHEKLFLSDDRIAGHEVDFARINAGVTTMPRVGLNPYALGMQLYYYLEEQADKGRLSLQYERLRKDHERRAFDAATRDGTRTLFDVRRNCSDFTFISSFVDQEFVRRNNLFVVGRRLNRDRMVWEYYVKSRSAEDYRAMLVDSLYHPPAVTVCEAKTTPELLYLDHRFEGKPLVKDYIGNALLGIEFLWGAPVKLETSEVVPQTGEGSDTAARHEEQEPVWRRVVYTMRERQLSKAIL